VKRFITALVAAIATACAAHHGIDVTDAYVIPPVPGRSVAVAYMTVHNSSRAAVVLIGAHSAAASSIEFHTHIRDGDMLRMRPVESVNVPAGEAFSFEPGGHHLMLFGFHPPRDGMVAIELQFKDHAPSTVEFEVRGRTGDHP